MAAGNNAGLAVASMTPRHASRLERAYAYLGVVYYEQGIIQALRTARGEAGLRPGGSDIVSTVTQLLILVVLLAILAARWRNYAPLLRHLSPYGAIVALCLLSVLWSDNPLPTVRRGSSLLTCVLFGIYLTRTFELRGAIAMAGRCAVFLGVLSIAVFVAAPSVGRETALGYERAMRGVFSQKNPMAECMLLGLTCYAFRMLQEGVRRSHVACVLLLLLCIALGRSATSLGIAMLVLLLTMLTALRGRPRLRLVIGFCVGWAMLAAVVMLAVAPELMFNLAGRDASLTGRGPLWHELLRVIAERPLLGHGYAGFWNEDSREVQYLWLLVGWQAPDSHNGYLDVTVQIGLVGLALYMVLWGRVTLRGLAAYRYGGPPESRWVLLFMLVNYVLNLDEGPLPFPDEFTMLMPGALITLGVWHQARRTQLARLALLPAPRIRFAHAEAPAR